MIGLPNRFFETLEGIASRILGVALAGAVMLAIALQIEDIQRLSFTNQIVSWFIVVLVGLMECLYVVLLLTTRSADTAIAPMPVVAMGQPRFPKLLRPIAAVFWLAHFLLIIALIYVLHESTGTPASVAGWAGVYSLAFLFHFLAFGYLLLILTAFTRDTEISAQIWSHRVLISLVIALLSIFAPCFLPIHRVD